MVEIRPTFKAKPGKFEDMKKFCKEVFVAGVVKAVETGTPDETACILYNFVVNEELETFICREGYTNAQVRAQSACIESLRRLCIGRPIAGFERQSLLSAQIPSLSAQ